MIVITMTRCPNKLRGDLTRWLQEIDTGVYVGNASARVREELWKRICDHADIGRVTMAYTTNTAQGYSILTYNTAWTPVEYDGLTLMMHPLPPQKVKKAKAKAENRKTGRTGKPKKEKTVIQKPAISEHYIVVDLETGGLQPESDGIIELAALEVVGHEIKAQYHSLVKRDRGLPQEIVKLTGITDEMLLTEGRDPRVVMTEFLEFIGKTPLVFHNARFDLGFLQKLCIDLELPILSNDYRDTLTLSRKLLKGLESYRLVHIAGALEIDITKAHRALEDSLITMQIFEKLNNISGFSL